ncbi:MAG: helix-turn-helix transcriptional regulator [Pseudanabaenales cyanobacterium]|nr:helix-turn-helix transcriptional regulator [Pseudanabaenales cyanobacterium]
MIDAPGICDCLEFEFQLAGSDAGFSFFTPYFGLKGFVVKLARKRHLKIEVWFKRPALMTYLQALLERISTQNWRTIERITQSIYQYRGGNTLSTTAGMLNQIFQGEIAKGRPTSKELATPMTIAPRFPRTFEHILTDALYFEFITLKCAGRRPIAPAMKQVIGQILGCPYQGATRRTYLERQALELADLYLKTIVLPRLNEADLNCIYQAESILKNQMANPPAVEALARQVSTNRLKLNQGFHQVYGATPGGYSRNCRLWQARRLLMTSDLSIGQVTATVGYTCRGNFAKIFRQQMSLTPKVFQMEVWRHAG